MGLCFAEPPLPTMHASLRLFTPPRAPSRPSPRMHPSYAHTPESVTPVSLCAPCFKYMSVALVVCVCAAWEHQMNPSGATSMRAAHDLARAKRSSSKASQTWEEALAPSSPDECENLCSDYDTDDIYDELQDIADDIDDNVRVLCVVLRVLVRATMVVHRLCVGVVAQMQDVVDALEARYFMMKKLDTQLQPLHDAIVSKASELSSQDKVCACACACTCIGVKCWHLGSPGFCRSGMGDFTCCGCPGCNRRWQRSTT